MADKQRWMSVRWISADKQVPEANDNIKYLVCCQTVKGIRSVNMAWYDGSHWHGMGSMSGVTHWMTLPELPEAKDGAS